MTNKRPQLNMRLDDFTDDVIAALVEKTDKDKSKVVRDALEFYGMYVLGQEEVMNLRLYKHFEKK